MAMAPSVDAPKYSLSLVAIIVGSIYIHSIHTSDSGHIPRGPDSPDNLECVLTWGTKYSIPKGRVDYNYVKLIIF